MFRFNDPIYLWLLLVIPVLLLIRFVGWRRRKAKLRKFGDPDLLKLMMPDVSKYRPTIKFVLAMIALTLLIVMLARPQMGSKISHEKRSGIEAVIAVDVSNSMYAQDVEPSRMDKAKMLIEDLIDNFSNDKIGLVVFAGDAYIQLPVTNDYVSAKMFLQDINPGLIQGQGTNIAEAINLCQQSFSQDKNVGKAVIVITDGEDHEGGAEQAAAIAHQQGSNVYILGIGTDKGAPIPMAEGGYMTDNTGTTVFSRLNEKMCKAIAAAGSGKFIHVDNTGDAEKELNEDLSLLQKSETNSVIYNEYGEQFQAVGIIILVLLILEICISSAKTDKLKRLIWSKKTSMILLLFFMGLSASAQSDRSLIRQGNSAYRSQKIADAETSYRKALAKNKDNSQAMYNLGMAMVAKGEVDKGVKYLETAAKMEPNKVRRAMSYHNIGTIKLNSRNYDAAIAAYENALRNNPNDSDTRYDLALAKKLKKSRPQNNQQQKKNDKKKNKEKKKEKKKDKKEENRNENNNSNQQKDKSKMSQENAERLLNAAIQNEKSTKQKLRQSMSAPGSKRYSKNW